MKQQRQPPVEHLSETRWRWPLDIAAYDRRIELSPEEIDTLDCRYQPQSPRRRFKAISELSRLIRLLEDVIAHLSTRKAPKRGLVALMMREVHRRRLTYWGWSLAEWRETLGPDYESFCRRHHAALAIKLQLMAVGYLLQRIDDLHAVAKFNQLSFVKKVFNAQAVEASIERVRQELQRWGYGQRRTIGQLPGTLSEIMIVARSPYLEDIRLETLQHARHSNCSDNARDSIEMVSRALFSFGIIPSVLPPRLTAHERFGIPHAEAGVPAEWLSWSNRWRETSTLRPKTRHRVFHTLCKTGRWLAHTHPEILTPADWTRELAVEYVAVVDRMKIGEWTHASTIRPEKVGRPLSASSKFSNLVSLRCFFQDCQEWGWIKRNFDPRRSLATPRSIRALIKPNPKVIAADTWAKLLWAGLNLTVDDLPKGPHDHTGKERGPCYPLEMARALALVWLFAGLRSDEVRRLRVGCIRLQREEIKVADTDTVLSADTICWLAVPANKTNADFVKPVDRAVGEAILAWEKIRPEQPPAIDHRTGEAFDCLFSYRGQVVGAAHLNKRLIPMLCRKAGVPEADAQGPITSHRARSTITSQLYNARDPMSIWDLKEWLGHRHLASTEYYVKPTPTKLAKSYSDAEYFKRNLRHIAVLVDQEAVKNGAAASGEAWKFYDLGHGYCTYDFFEQCPHRMACAKCSFYVPKESSRAQLLEAKTNLLRMMQEIPLQEEERAAVEDGLNAVEKLYAQLMDVPTPAGPTPRELRNDVGRELPILSAPVIK